jgi:hypothetical protein
MLGNYPKFVFVLALFVTVIATVAWAESSPTDYDPCIGARLDCPPGAKGITKVKPTTPEAIKVRPYPGVTSRFEALSRLNPMNWWADCFLPTPAKGQFQIEPKVTFGRIQGEARRGLEVPGLQSSLVDFDDHLGLKKSGNVVWSVEALYQFRPRWGIRYSFTPIFQESSNFPRTSFNFMGTTFASATEVRSKWDHVEHRAGIYFNLSQTQHSLTNVYADWLNVQDKLSIGTGVTSPVVWNDTKNLAVTGLEFSRCLKNFHGNTLAFKGKGGIAFLNDTIGYEAEVGLSYLIPIKTGRFGVVEGGYRYSHLKKDRPTEVFGTTIDGAFLQVGFLF